MSVTARRLRLLKHGYEPVPCNGKLPVLADWQRIETTPAEIERWGAGSSPRDEHRHPH
jgi:hypothetical protein